MEKTTPMKVSKDVAIVATMVLASSAFSAKKAARSLSVEMSWSSWVRYAAAAIAAMTKSVGVNHSELRSVSRICEMRALRRSAIGID
jgi:hypothetical protein